MTAGAVAGLRPAMAETNATLEACEAVCAALGR